MRLGTTMLLGLVFATAACGSADSEPDRSSGTLPAVRVGPVPGSDSAACADWYSLEKLRDRDFAFDGTVIDVGSPASNRGDGPDLVKGVTFEVNEWFAGGDGDEVTVDLHYPDNVDGEDELPFQSGTRLLVSGEPAQGGAPLDAPMAWQCGFTQYYDKATAQEWREITGG